MRRTIKRFTTIMVEENCSIEKDNYNDTYAVYIKCDRFKQQISKHYYKKGWAIRKLNKVINTNKIKL